MRDDRHGLGERARHALGRHLEVGDEETLSAAYEFGRAALAEGAGVLDMAVVLWRAALATRVPTPGGAKALHHRLETFLLECLSPFEMAHRGTREANQALRYLDERREEQARRIAREIHDEAGQLLAAAHPSLEALRPHLDPDGQPHLGRALEMLRRAGDELRRIAHELRPSVLDDFGLLPALRLLAAGASQRTGLVVQVLGAAEGRLPPRVETTLYRAAQEGIHNVVRHAQASHATIELVQGETEVVCCIRDDGRGMDPDAAPAPDRERGLGLEGIRERIAPLGGALEIWSSPGGGTELQIRIPMEVAHATARADR